MFLLWFSIFNDSLFGVLCYFNSLPNDKILDLSKLKAFADDKIILTQKLKFGLRRVENIVKQEDHDGPISHT